MRRTLLPAVVAASLVGLVTLSWSVGRSAPDPTKGGLPGARPEIDASRYPTLQAAFDALPAEGGLIRLPAGTFEIDESLVISQQDVRIEGAGTATHIHNTNAEGQPALFLRPDKGFKDKDGKERIWRVMLSNFRITGNEKSGVGIHAKWVQEIFLQGVTVSEHGGHGIFLDYCYEDPRISDCLITYNKGAGVHLLGCHDIIVSANQFEENQDALHCFEGFNLCMTGNNLDDHLGHGVVIEDTYGSVVSGNMIEECKGTAIILDRDCYGNTISANEIAHNGGGIDLRDAHGCAVSANTITICASHAVRIGPDSGRITVTGNNLSNSYVGDGKIRRRENDMLAAGMTIEGASDVTVSGNLFSDVKPKALELVGEGAQRVLFANNVLTSVESDHGKLKKSLVTNNLESEAASDK